MPTDKDLFTEEQDMVAMSFGEHIEELRTRLIYALLGLMIGVVITFVPPLNLGQRVIKQMEEPAKAALKAFYEERARVRAEEAQKAETLTPELEAVIPADRFVTAIKSLAPGLELPSPEDLKDQTVRFPVRYKESGMIKSVVQSAEPRDALVSLAPLETVTIFFMVCLVVGLVVASPWVFYQIWAFVAAGLYRHERHYVKKFLPMSLGLFLTGVFLCFFGVLPITLAFLLEFNVWLGIEPTLRLADWMSFATILPLVFGLCFQTPLVMLFLERIGVFTVDDYRSKRKIAILVIVVAGAVLTPGQDPFSQCLLAGPMIILYELGILLVGRQRPRAAAMAE
jgi:sec-independent protein translocase protein TatC